MNLYKNWRILRWETPVVDLGRLMMVSLTDAGRELTVLFEDTGDVRRPRWRVRFEHYPAYRNIDEAYRLDLWNWLDASDQRVGCTFVVEETPPLTSWGTGYLHEAYPEIRHFVIATDDDVVEVLATAEPTWETADPGTMGEPVPGKSQHLYIGEDDEQIAEMLEKLKTRSHPPDSN